MPHCVAEIERVFSRAYNLILCFNRLAVGGAVLKVLFKTKLHEG